MSKIFFGVFTGSMKRIPSAVLLMALVSPVYAAGEDVFTGILFAYTDDEDKITEAQLEISTLNEIMYYNILMNEAGMKMAAAFDGQEVEITGELVEKEDEEWLSVKKCSLVLLGTVEVKEGEDGKLKSVAICREFDDESVEVFMDPTSQRLASELKGRMVRAVGNLTASEKNRQFRVERYSAVVSGTGYFEKQTDEKGVLTGLWFSCVKDHQGKEMDESYKIQLNDAAKSLAETYEEEEMVVLVGFLTEDKSGGKWLTVLSCDSAPEDEEESDDEDDGEDDEEWEEDG